MREAGQMLADLARLAEAKAARGPGPTAVPRLTIWRSVAPTEPAPAMFKPKLYLPLQGTKRMTVGRQAFDFGPGDYALLSVGLPFLGQVTEASRERPYLALDLALDPGLVAGLLIERPDLGAGEAPALAVREASPDVLEPLGRLLGLLDRPADIPMLAPQVERELCYRLLQGPMGPALRQVVRTGTRFHQVRTAAEWLRAHADGPLRVGELAASVGMSVTSFHRHFKLVTGHSPLAYQRHVRLIEARRLIASGTTDVTRTAFATGYASPSQFSREYKRMFGVPPIRDAAVLQH